MQRMIGSTAHTMNRSAIGPHDDTSTAIPCHPLGVKPSGNAYTSTKNHKKAAGYFYYLLDEVIVFVLEYLDLQALVSLGFTCKALYAFSRLEDLWKTLFIQYVW